MDNLSVVAILAAFGICLAHPAFAQVIQLNGNALVPPVRSVVVPINPKVSFRPYGFGYEFGDGLGMSQHRSEFADGTGAVRGSYSYLDNIGLNRVVEYIADSEGYKAVVRTNEPGVAAQNPADALFEVRSPPPAAVAQGLLRRAIPIAAL